MLRIMGSLIRQISDRWSLLRQLRFRRHGVGVGHSVPLGQNQYDVGRSDVDDDDGRPRVAISLRKTLIKISTVIKKFK